MAAAPRVGAVAPVVAKAAPASVALAAIAALAAANGGYFSTSWGWAALGLAWVGIIAGVFNDSWPLTGRDRIVVGALVGLVAWTGASAAWSTNVSQTVLELERGLIYVAGTLAVLLIARRQSVSHLLGGVLAAIGVISAYGLATRLFPDRIGVFDPIAVYRLSEPLGYWNALGIFAAIGIPLSLGFAARARRLAVRSVAAAALVVLVPTVYFTFGRGPWVALAIGLLAAIGLDPRRLQLITMLALLAPAPALVVWIGSRSPALTRQQSRLAEAAHDGHRLALVVIGLAAASAVLALVVGHAESRLRPARALRQAWAVLLVLAGVALIAALFVRFGGPVTIVRHAHAAFKAPPVGITAPGSNLNRRLFSFSGNGRAELWGVARDDYRAHPWRGSGAGTYERYWLAHRTRAAKLRDAHGLYVEILAELGPVGLSLLIVALAVPIAAAVRARRLPLVPAAAGAYIAYVVHAGVDWDWEMSGVTLTALICGAALLVAARRETEPRRISLPIRMSVVGALLVLAGFAFVGLVGNDALSASKRAVTTGDGAKAEAEARRAIRWAPWSVEPLKALAQAQLVEGDRAAAQATLRRAIAKDRRDWDLWYRLALASEGPTFRKAIAAAARLNPLSPEIAELRSARRARS